jgi:hypothetical protein
MSHLHRSMHQSLALLLWVLFLVIPIRSIAYPLDAYPATEIRRIEATRLAALGRDPGARLPSKAVDLRLLNHADLKVPKPDPDFSDRVV